MSEFGLMGFRDCGWLILIQQSNNLTNPNSDIIQQSDESKF